MSADTTPASLNDGRAPVVVIQPQLPSLDVQILQAENAVLQRDRQVRDSLVTVGRRARETGSHVGMALAVTAATAAVAWLLLRQRAVPIAAAAAPGVKRRASLALVRGAAFLWPLLPVSVKSRVSGALVDSVLRSTPLLGRAERKSRAERRPGE